MTRPGEEALEATWRARAVAALVPHVAHRINNALSVVRGLADLMGPLGQRGLAPADRPEGLPPAAVMSEQAAEAARLQGLLADLATGHEGRSPHDLAETLEGLGTLFECAALAARHDLAVVRPGSPVPVGASAGSALLCGALLAWAALGGPEADRARLAERGPGRLRLSVCARGARAALGVAVLRRAEAPEPVWSDELRTAADAAARAAGGSLRARRIGRALSLSLVLPAHGEAELPRVTARRAARVVVVEPDDLLAGLLGDVLREAGYRVSLVGGSAEARAALSEPADLLLVEADVRARTAAELGASGTPLVTLGEGPPPCLPKPFRPAELLDLVESVLARSPG